MTSDAAQDQQASQENEQDAAIQNLQLPSVNFKKSKSKLDYATVLGLFFAIGLIFAAIYVGQSNANFFNGPSILIVLLGTVAATSISYTSEELSRATKIIGNSLMRQVHDPKNIATNLISLAIIARKKGILALSGLEADYAHNPFLVRALQMVMDGYPPEDIQRTLGQEIEALEDRHKRSASITLRASEIAPSMGLIGTLVGLVQMLADLENPETIGPSMAVALLTTFYGAILGTIVMAPLAVKLEKNSADESMVKTMIAIAAISIAKQDNPRRLEMLLNAELPPSQRINYFEER